MRYEHLYVHVPFCARRCVYCDFSIAVRPSVPVDDYVDALSSELRLRHAASRLDLATLYFGGGTPSKLGGEGIARAIDAISSIAHIRKEAEVTIEANPEDVTPGNVHVWKSAGVNRVSLGVQSFHDSVLAWMHRTHDASAARQAVNVLREGGLANISIDLIFAAPVNLAREWREDLDAALEFELPHVSLYGLTVEPHTPLGRRVARRDVHEAPEENYEGEFLQAERVLTGAGYEHYEVSNYAKSGFQSRHNWAYWNRLPYAGLGPSAHEFDGTVRRWNRSAYAAWLEDVSGGRDPVEGSEILSSEQAQAEELYLGLRTAAGVVVQEQEPASVTMRRWLDSGWGTLADDSRLRLRGSGWLRLDSIATDLTAFRSRY